MPIDMVIPWIDSNYPETRKTMNQYQTVDGEDNSEPRYRDWKLFHFLLRGIEQFTPWVNMIYIIVNHHVPEWLNIQMPQIRIIEQETLLPDYCSDCFNINAIELNLHRIPDISEQFIYLNDDMFFLKPTPKEMFFLDGVPCDSASLSPIIVTKRLDVGSIVVNNMCIINQYFNKHDVICNHIFKWLNPKYGIEKNLRTICLLPWRHLPGFYNHHLPQPFLRETFEELWKLEEKTLREVSMHRFRNYRSDVNQWLMRYWQLCKGTFHPVSSKRGKDLNVLNIDEIVSYIKKQKYNYVCINDSDAIQNIEPYKQRLFYALEEILPKKSGFEL